MLNFLTGKIVSKSLGSRRILNSLTRRSWTFLRAQKFILMGVYVLITEASGINAKRLREIQKIRQFYTISSLIRVKLEETGPSRIITHMVDLKELFPDVDIENL